MNNPTNEIIECPRCGSAISINYSTCPSCGLNLYPDADEDQDLLGKSDQNHKGIPTLSILIGGLAGAGAAFVLNFMVRGLDLQLFSQRIFISVVDIFGGLVSGLVTGYIIKDKPVVYGVTVGLFSVIWGWLFEFYWQDIGFSSLFKFDLLMTWALMIFCAVVGTILAYRKTLIRSYTFPEEEYLLYRELLNRAQNDHGVVERLIAYERERAPGSSRRDLLRDALERWNRDNRV